MPFIRITLGKNVALPRQQVLARRATELIATILRKRAEVTAVQVVTAGADAWCIAGDAIAPTLTPSHAELFITEGTNTPAEKAEMIAALHGALEETCGPLPEASYIVIREVPAGSWGYGGLTQAARQQARQGL
jgi:4-oxalocrotonate tautomerase